MMKIGNYELSPDTRFYTSFDEERLVTCGAGGDIPLCAIWVNGKPKPYDMKNVYLLSCTPERFQDLYIFSQVDE